MVEASGSGAAVATGLKAVKKMGQYVQVGIIGEEITVDYDTILYKQLKVFGVLGQLSLQSAIACRRIGDIRQLLGQLEKAAEEYGRAIERLVAIEPVAENRSEIALELARAHNGLGNIESARLDVLRALAYE